MSGLEVVGVVLGSIPLVISALEHYRDGLRTIQRWRKYDRELQSLIRNLTTEQAKFKDICEKLLMGIVQPSRIEMMVEKPLGDLWLEKETQKKIKARLWRNWDVFEGNLKDIKAAIEEMMERLDDGAKDNSSITRGLKRANFTFSRSSYAEFMSRIKDGVSNLESLTTSSIELEPSRRVRSRVRLLSILRQVTASIYRAIRASLICTCKHAVNLRLSNWTTDIAPGDDDEDIARELKFHVALSYTLGTFRLPPSLLEKEKHLWEEVSVKATSPPTQQAVSACTSQNPCPSPTQRMTLGRREKSVRFSASQSFSSSTTLVQTETATLATAISRLTVDMTHIGLSNYGSIIDLCEHFRKARGLTKAECLGIMFDQQSQRRRCFAVYPLSLQNPGDETDCEMVSLRSILEEKDVIRPMSYRNRLQLAVLIASSVLQLHKTPWLPSIPTSRNVYFAKRNNLTHYDRAFVTAEAHSSGNSPASIGLIRNPKLLALGILLLEVIRGETIDSLRKPDEMLSSSHNLLADYMTAQRVLPEVYQLSSNYGSAVRRCIDGEFQREQLDLDNEDFCQEVYSGVVALLEEDLSHT